MSKRLYFSQYESPNIVIVPTVSPSCEPSAKKTRLENQTSVEIQNSGISACEPGKNLNMNISNHPDMNYVREKCTVKKHPNNITVPCRAVNDLISTDELHKKPMKQLETKKNTSIIQPLCDLHTIKMETLNNINEHPGERINLMATDIQPSNCLSDSNDSNKNSNKNISFPEYNKNKELYNSTSNNEYNIITKPHQTNSDKGKTSTSGKKLKRKIADTKSKIIKKIEAKNFIDKDSDSDFEEQKYHTNNTKFRKIDCLEAHNVNKDTSKTDKKIAKSHQKHDKKYEPDKSSNISNANKVSTKTISNLPSTVSTKYKTTKIRRKQITKYKEEQTENRNCKLDSKDKIQCTPKQDGHKPSLKKMTQGMKVTPIKSVVQVTKYFGLTPSKNRYRPAKPVDLRTKINLKNQTNTEKLRTENYSHSKQNQVRDNLRITVNNLNTQTEDKTKLPDKSTKSKFKRCKKINLIINVICQKRMDESLESLSSEPSDSDDDENNSSCVPTADLSSFLDDINVDEIVESLKYTKHESNAKVSNSLDSSDLHKLDHLSTEITIKTEKENIVSQNDNLINKESCSRDIFVNQTENKKSNNERLPNVDGSNNQISAERKLTVQNKYKTDTPPTVDIKQEILDNECQQKDIQTINTNSIKKEDDTISECSTVIIGELIHSDNGEETFDNIDESFTEDDFPNIHSYIAETVSTQPVEVEVDIAANELNDTDLINLYKNPFNMTNQTDDTPRHECNSVLNVNDKSISEINHEPTETHHVTDETFTQDNNEGEHNAAPELNTVQSQANSDGTVLNNIEKELSILNNEVVHEEQIIESNDEHFRHNSATTKTIKDDILEKQTASEPQVIEIVTDAIIGDACPVPILTNNGNDLLPIALNTPVGTSKTEIIADIGEKCVNENKTEKKDTCYTKAGERSDTEVVKKKPLFPCPIVQGTKGLNSNNAEDQNLAVKENKTDTPTAGERIVTEVVKKNPLLPSPIVQVTKGLNSINTEDQNLTVNENKTNTPIAGERSDTEVAKKKPLLPSPIVQGTKALNSMNAEDKILAVKLERRMSDYFKKKYSVMSLVRNGRFSKIFRCQDTNGQDYALKILNNECDRHVLGVSKEQMHMAIQKEIPRENYFCVYVINGFSLSGYWCFLMEYYPKNLEEALRENNKSFHIDIVQTLARQLISAVTILRNHHVVHSDITPRHVLVNGRNDRLKLCGFDRSYYIDTVDVYPNIGTTSYRPPEVILGFSAGFSLDVWTTALVMYQMATNIKLFPGASNNDILYKQLCTIGNIPFDMLQRSWYKNYYFVENGFIRRHDYRGQESIIWSFNKSQRINRTIITTYHRDWRSERTMNQQVKDIAKLHLLIRLLERMLVLDPRHRLPIEFAFADPFIYEAYYM